jgi:hypothetical protein
MTEIITVSVKSGDIEYMKEHELSPSALLRIKINELREKKTFPQQQSLLIEPATKIAMLSQRYQNAVNYIADKGMIEDFLATKR